jgi:hypothetical protein
MFQIQIKPADMTHLTFILRGSMQLGEAMADLRGLPEYFGGLKSVTLDLTGITKWDYPAVGQLKLTYRIAAHSGIKVHFDVRPEDLLLFIALVFIESEKPVDFAYCV